MTLALVWALCCIMLFFVVGFIISDISKTDD